MGINRVIDGGYQEIAHLLPAKVQIFSGTKSIKIGDGIVRLLTQNYLSGVWIGAATIVANESISSSVQLRLSQGDDFATVVKAPSLDTSCAITAPVIAQNTSFHLDTYTESSNAVSIRWYVKLVRVV